MSYIGPFATKIGRIFKQQGHDPAVWRYGRVELEWRAWP